MKNAYYFSHDFNSRNDPKLVKLLMHHGVTGIGVFWCMIEMLHEQNGYFSKDECERIAFELRTQCDLIKSVLDDFQLFQFDGERYYSKSVLLRMKLSQEKSNLAKKSALARWQNRPKNENNEELDANAMRTQCERNAVKEKKGNEKKGNEISESAGSENGTSPITTKKQSREKKQLTELPDDFELTSEMISWASKNGYQDLERRMVAFKEKCVSKGYKYANWKMAFYTSVREDWARLNNSKIIPVTRKTVSDSSDPDFWKRGLTV